MQSGCVNAHAAVIAICHRAIATVQALAMCHRAIAIVQAPAMCHRAIATAQALAMCRRAIATVQAPAMYHCKNLSRPGVHISGVPHAFFLLSI